MPNILKFLRGLVAGLAANRGGNVAMIFALTALPITVFVGGSVDLSRMRVERTKLQSAVDAAALAATYMPANSTDAQIKATIDSFIAANFDGFGTVNPATTRFQRTGNSVEVWASAAVPMTFAAVLGFATRPVSAHAKAQRGGVNVEIALVLDITASMGMPSSKIAAAKDAADQLIDIVVRDIQTPYYSRMAIVPFSNSVNAGTRANALRGTPPTNKDINGLAWTAGQKTPTGISNASQGVVTLNNHGYATGDVIYFSGVKGMTQLNGNIYTVEKVNNNTFKLRNSSGNIVNTNSYGTFSTSGSGGNTARMDKCLNAGCTYTVTSPSHGLAANELVRITGVSGSSGPQNLNNSVWKVRSVTDNNTYVLDSGAYFGTYSSTSNDKGICYSTGCANFQFTRADNGLESGAAISTCVSERTGPEAYTDASPAAAPLGDVYDLSSSCPNSNQTPVTLSSNRNTLHGKIDNLSVTGSTAGQIGIAWGWYMLSPNFNTALGNNAAAYDTPETVKIAVIMTDGDFNTGYCQGVISNDSTDLVSRNQKINCEADNAVPLPNNHSEGGAFEQATALCAAMKTAGIKIYTVAFDVAANSPAARIMAGCASDTSSAYLASNSTQLNAAFRAIGDSIGRLRLTQ